jgi:hypothetical protein
VGKLKIFALIISLVGLISVIGCKKTTNNTVVMQDSVFYSPWTQLKMTTIGDTVYYQDITASKLTQSLLNTGVVLSYLGSPGTSDTAISNASDYGLYQVLHVGYIEVQSYGYLNDFSYSNSGFLYRYVIIPGSVLTTTSLKNFSVQQLNKMSYTDVQKAIGKADSSGSSSNKLTGTN